MVPRCPPPLPPRRILDRSDTPSLPREDAGPGGDPDRIVRTERLGKRYGDFEALRDCTMSVRRGEIFGLLGPNGAGKSTLIRLLLGFLQPTSGLARVDGLDVADDGVNLRRRVAYLPGDARLPRHLKGDGVLRFFADIHPGGNFDRSRRIADDLELDRSRRVGFMSTGMRQKLALAVVLGLDTPLLILDEPTANLDPSVRSRILELVIGARAAGRTVMLSSHVLSEIEDTCDRVMFLRRGEVAKKLVMSDLFQRHRVWAEAAAEQSIEVPPSVADRVSVVRTGERVRMDVSGDLAAVLPWISDQSLRRLRIEPLGLRTIYNEVHDDTGGLDDSSNSDLHRSVA